jgi:hypothetical protein
MRKEQAVSNIQADLKEAKRNFIEIKNSEICFQAQRFRSFQRQEIFPPELNSRSLYVHFLCSNHMHFTRDFWILTYDCCNLLSSSKSQASVNYTE